MESANARRTQWVPGVGVGVAFLVPAVLGYMLANQLHQQRWGVGWNTSQYFFSYQELGFVSRGLIGSLLAPFPSMQQPGSILALSSLVLLVLVGAAVKGYWRAAAAIEGRGHWVLLLLMASSPALFLHLGFDLGRFDAIGIGIFLGSVAAIRRDAWLLAGVGAAVGLLVHEAFLLLNLPLLAAFAFTARDRGGSPIRWGMLAGPPCVALLALGLAGRYEPGAAGLQEIFGRSPRYLTAVGGSVQIDQLAVLTRGVADNWDFVRHEFVATKAYFHWPLPPCLGPRHDPVLSRFSPC